MARSTIKKFLEAGVQFTEMSRKQAEALVKGLVKSGEVHRKDAEQLVLALLERGKQTTDKFATAVQAEVAKQVAHFQPRLEELEHRIEALTGIGRSAAPAPKPAPAKKAAAKTGGAKKAAGKKAAAKKGAAKKGPAKKGAAKKKGAAVGSSGVRKVTTSRPA